MGKKKSYFFLGIKGVMMANLAVILKKMGNTVSGVDSDEEFITNKLLSKHTIDYTTDFKQPIPDNIDYIVYSAAHKGTQNPLIKNRMQSHTILVAQTQLLNEVMDTCDKKVAVSGCHGKTTTSSLLSFALINLGVKPSYCVGVPFFDGLEGCDYQKNEYFVVEADEYGVNPPTDKTPKFNFLNPTEIICTNIDFDHPDVYKNLEDTKNAFMNFFGNKKLILCGEDLVINNLMHTLPRSQYVSYGFDKKNDYYISNIQCNETSTSFGLIYNNKKISMFQISLFGHKNILNATSVIIYLLSKGFTFKRIQSAIETFQGAARRFEKVFEDNSIQLFDDYAHHPSEIQATIESTRLRFPNKRIILIFQPHTFSRTHALVREFGISLSRADICFILPIFASAREKSTDYNVSSKDIASNSSKRNLYCVNDQKELENAIKMHLNKDDVIITMGAGDVYKLKDQIIKQIQNFNFIHKNK